MKFKLVKRKIDGEIGIDTAGNQINNIVAELDIVHVNTHIHTDTEGTWLVVAIFHK